jgi:hypothetical protein
MMTVKMAVKVVVKKWVTDEMSLPPLLAGLPTIQIP